MWVVLSLVAGSFQAARNGFARSLAGKISPALNSWARFTFNLPFSTLLVAALASQLGTPRLSVFFYGYCLGTAVTQLLGNIALVAAFRRANFAQSIVLHKLEVVFTAIVGVALFSEYPSLLGWFGVVASTAGVLLMNFGRDDGPAGWRRALHFDSGALLSLTCGMLLVFASFMLKEATLEFAMLNPRVGSGRFEAAAYTLFHTTWMEVVLLTAGLSIVSPREFRHVTSHWPRMTLIGFTGFAGSLCWFWAYSLTLIAYVKAVGQIESLFAIAMAVLIWREQEVWRQLPGIALIVVGIALVLLG